MRSDKYNSKENKKKDKNKSTNKKQKNGLIPKSPLLIAILLLLLMAEAVFLLLISTLDILPGKYAAVLLTVLLVMTLLCMKLMGCRNPVTAQRKVGVAISLIMIVTMGVGCFYLYNTYDTLNKISTEKKQTEDFYVVVLNEGSYETVEDIENKQVFVLRAESKTYKEAKGKLMSEAAVTYEKVSDYIKLSEKLIDEQGKRHDEIIFLSDTNYMMLCEETVNFESNTKIIHTISVEIESSDIAKRVDVTKDPYNIYISGIDTYGSISNVARSDVNMIMTVNPKTRTILLTSIPRDMYLPLHSYGAMDKLTHTGIYGIEETTTTVEDWLGIDINYFIRVNFSTLEDVVDAIGGIEVDSEYAFSSAISDYSYSEGINYLNGEEALYFARERKSFSDGDNQRVKNQQKVLSGIIEKITGSTAILTSYAELLNAIEDEMQTNMASSDISSLVKMQLGDMRGWSIKSVSAKGQGASKPTYSMGSINLSVIIPDEKSVTEVQQKINKTMYPVEE